MANTSSAKKAIRRQKREKVKNDARRNAFRSARKAVMKAISNEDKKEAETALSKFNKAVEKASKHNGPLHKNTAARYMSQLAKKVNQAFAK